MPVKKKFSTDVEKWLDSNQPKTFGKLVEVFGEESFATIFILCMALPALPIPTGGITHVLEVVTMIVAVQFAVGLNKLWLPDFLSRRKIPKVILAKAMPLFVRYLKRLETYSRVRGAKILHNSWVKRFAGVFVFVFTLGAFLSVPFSGLDTVASLGVVVLSLGLVAEDISFFIIGILLGILGVGIEITIGAAVAKAIRHFWDHGSPNVKYGMLAAVFLLLLVLVLRHFKKK